MRIAQISTPFLRVPPSAYGGTERIVGYITEKLVQRGHSVTLYATGDSITNAQLRSWYAVAQFPFEQADLAIHTTLAFQDAHQFDIIHNHNRQGIICAPLVSTPTLHTVHEVLNTQQRRIYSAFENQNLVAISHAHRRDLSELRFLDVVYNGVDTDELSFNSVHDDYLLHIGYLSKRKGTHNAVEVAKRSGKKLILAGKVFPHSQDFFDQAILPHIDGEQIQYIGEVGGEERLQVLQKAQAILVPVEWEEPFGLVMAEAMSCGTPVLGFRRGSVPEVVKHGYTGYVVDTVDEMVAATKRLDEINRADCRSHVLENFTIDRMVDAYEKMYDYILKEKK